MIVRIQFRELLTTIFILTFLGMISLNAQVNIQVQVYGVSTSIGNCDGGFFNDNESDPTWWFEGGDIPQFDCNLESTDCNGCSLGVNMTLINETYDCPSDFPSSLSYNFHGCETDFIPPFCLLGLVSATCDGGGIDVNQTIQFQNIADDVVFNGTTYDFNANPNIDFGQICYTDNTGCSGNWCYNVRIVRTGSFINTDNDIPCDATPLGTIALGGSLGNESNHIYQNLCGTPDSQPNDWTSNQGVWFSFQTGSQVGTQLTFELETDGTPIVFAGDIDLQASIFMEDGSCNSLIEVADGVDLIDVTYNETVSLACPLPNTTYYILVDGGDNPLDVFDLTDEEDGYFGIGIYDDGVSQAADMICDAEYLGAPTPGTSVTTNINTQSNICATGINDPNPGFNWDIGNGVWYEFTAPPSGSVNIDIDSDASTLNIFEQYDLDVYVALYTTLDDVCDPTFNNNQLEFIDEQHSLFSPCGLEPPGENDAYDESMDIYCLEPGQSYWIFIDGAENLLLALPPPTNGDAGYFSITVSDLQRPPAPNNLICDAIALDGGVQLAPGQSASLNNQSNRCADNFYEPYDIVGTCNTTTPFTNEQGVWYTFVAPISGAVNIWGRNISTGNTCLLLPQYEDAIHIELSVFALQGGPDCVNLPPNDNFELICAESEELDDIILGGIGLLDAPNDEHMFVECLNPGQTYYILVDGLGLGSIAPDFLEGIFNIEIEAFDQPTPTGNDTPCEAVALGPLNGTDPTLYNNYCATTEPTDPIIYDLLDNAVDHHQTVWFTFEAPATGSVVVEGLNNGSDDISLQVGVYQSDDGTCNGNMIELNSDFLPIPFDEEVPEVYCLDPGEIYYIMVDGYDEPLFTDFLVEGDFQISITPTANTVVQTNDDICDATSFPGSPFTDGPQTLMGEHNLCAQNFNDSIPTCFQPDHTVWFTFDTPAGGTGYSVDIDIVSVDNIFDLFPDNLIMDPEIVIFESDNDACDGNLAEIACAYDPLSITFDFPDVGFSESINVQCLEPNSTYYIMVDGSFISLQGAFDITIEESSITNPSAPNDACVQAIDLGTVPTNGSINDGIDYTNYCALTDIGEAVPSSFGIDQTVWFNFTAPNDGTNDLSNVTINLLSDPSNLGDDLNIQIAVYESDGDCTGTFTEINSSANTLDGFNETLELPCLTPGQEYYIQIDGNNTLGSEGYFQIEIVDDGSSMAATNDDICNAIALGSIPNGGTINPGTTFTNLCATLETDEPNPNFNAGADDIDQTVWFTFTPSISGNVNIDALSDATNDVDLQLAVYYSADGSCDPTQLVPVDNAWNTGSLNETLTIPCLDPSITYYIQVDGSSVTPAQQSGNFTLEISDDGGSFSAPNNNDICDAADFGTITNTENLNNQTNECANVQLDEPGIFDYAQNTVWYQFVAPNSGQVSIEVTPLNSSTLIPEIYLFSSNAGACILTDLTLVDSEVFPSNASSFDLESTCIIPGDTYFIQIDGQAGLGATGQFNISITDLSPNYNTIEPSNNECFNAIPLFVQDESCFIGDGTWDIENYGQPTVSIDNAYTQSCNPSGNCGDTWYCFDLPPTGTVLIEGLDDSGGAIGDNSDLTVIAYTGDCNGLIPLDCEAGGSSANVSYEVEAVPGSKVYLQVFDGGGDDFNESFALCISEQCGADNCNFAIDMAADSVYCWNTASATGENITGGEEGYLECGDGSNPEHSIYFSFSSGCNGGSATVSLLNITYEDGNVGYIPCENFLGFQESALDGFTFTVFEDSTPCDGMEDALVYCEVFNGCDHNANNNDFSFFFDNLNSDTDYIIQIDGGVVDLLGNEVGGNVQGEIMIEVEPLPEIDSMVVVDSIFCFGGTGNITAIVNPGSYPFTFNWDNVSTDSIYMNVSPGWHYLTVTGSNGCEENDSIFLPEPPELFIAVALDSVILCNGSVTSATASGTGGTPDYTYEWSTTPPQLTATAIDLLAGTYTVTITDVSMCSKEESIVITEPIPIVPSVIVDQNVSCFGGSDASATASAIDGVVAVDYTYEWSTTPPQNTATATGLEIGTYTVTITDDNSCTATTDITITEPDELFASITLVQNVSCFEGSDGEATASGIGGTITTDYSYEWSDNLSQTTATVSGLEEGTYTVTLTDNNSCTATAEIVITEPTLIVPIITVNQHVTCNGGNNGEAIITATGGTEAGDYDYEWSTIPIQNTATASNLEEGTYTVTITDDNNCTVTAEAIITEPDTILPTIIIDQNVSCNSGTNGEATASATGGTEAGNYDYEWSTTPPQLTATASNLEEGTYTVTITDDNACTVTESVIITEPTIINPIATVNQNVSCFDGNNGEVNVTATGGTVTGDYSYEWSTIPAQTTATASNLTMGTYTVTITDDLLCTATTDVTITEPDELFASITLVQNVSCFEGSDGEATASGIGGTITTDYSYEWSDNLSQTTATASGLEEGIYTVTLTDNNLCTATAEIAITEPTLIVPITAVNQHVTCNGGNDGEAVVTATGGTEAGDYDYEWSTIPIQTTATASNLEEGTYTVTITDDNNCTVTAEAIITEPDTILPTIIIDQNVSCNSGTNGEATASATGGTEAGNYDYEWSTTPPQLTATASNLEEGTYTVTITDDNACTVTESVTITEPTIINPIATVNQNVSCFDGNNGEVNVTATGGTVTGDYTYEWSTIPAQTTATASNLTMGTYTVTVTDDLLCTATTDVTITEPTEIIPAITSQNVTCINGTNGEATASAIGGTVSGDYNYEWSTNPIQNTATAIDLEAGTYTVIVSDDNACTVTAEITITEPTAIIPSITLNQDVTCNGGNDGSATASAIGGTVVLDYTYEWNTNPIQTTATASGLIAGTYIVTITDDNLCTATNNIVINEPVAMIATAIENQVQTNCLVPDGIAQVTVVNGIPPYTYVWNTTPIQTMDIATGLASGTYEVTVSDATLCTATSMIFIDTDTMTMATANLTPASCFGGNDGEIEIVPVGVGPFTYNWNVGTGNPNVGLAAGDYTVTILNGNGCSLVQTYALGEATEITITDAIINPASCSDTSDGSIELTVNEGTSPYTYTWDGDALGQGSTASNLSPNIYNVTITDANNCTIVDQFNVSSPLPLLVNQGVITPANCFACDGTAEVIPSGGTAPYMYIWSNGISNNTATNLCSGTNTISVTDAAGCLVILNVIIDTISTLQFDTIVGIDAACNNSCDGEATMIVSSGAEPYSYQWDISAANQTTQTATGLCAGSYEVTATDVNGCLVIGDITISEPDPIGFVPIAMDATCFGDYDGSIEIDSAYGGLAPYGFALNSSNSFSLADTLFTNLSSGNYTVYMQDANLCIDSVEIFVSQPPELLLTTYPTDTLIDLGESLTLYAIPNQPNTTWDWSPTDSLDCTDCPTPIVAPTETILYTVIVTDSINGCTTTANLLIRVDKERNVFIPNAFTPNEDGYNDYLSVFADGTVSNINSFKVYDRWGELVFQKLNFQPNEPTLGWDGYFNGKRMNTGVFVYVAEITFIDGAVEIFKGDVTLVK